jgi:hypothetical protein
MLSLPSSQRTSVSNTDTQLSAPLPEGSDGLPEELPGSLEDGADESGSESEEEPLDSELELESEPELELPTSDDDGGWQQPSPSASTSQRQLSA